MAQFAQAQRSFPHRELSISFDDEGGFILSSVRPRKRSIPHILLVEDDDTDVMFVQRTLACSGNGAVLVVARDGEEALEILSNEILTHPYVIVTDLNMPGMSGHELIERIRGTATLCDSVIFVLSSSRLEEDIERSYRYNIAGYISKDVSTEELSASIQMLVSFCQLVHLPN